MSERSPVREDIRTPRNVVNELATHFERAKLPLTAHHLELMVQEIVIADLSTDPLTKYLGKTPLAKVEGGRITFDQRYEQLTPEQQRYILAHEYSHLLSWFFSEQAEQRFYQQAADRISNLPDSQISPYIESLRQTLPENDETSLFIEEEKQAEIIAQYLTSDRTFAGFVTTQLLQFEAGPNPQAELEQLRGGAVEITDLAAYLDLADDEEEREKFLDHHENLRERYEIWQSLNELFENADFDELGSPEVAQFLDQETWEDDELALHLHAEELPEDTRPRTGLSALQPKPEPAPPFANLLTFWRLYP